MSLHGDNPTTACDHWPANRGAAVGVVCALCHAYIEPKPCKACKGMGFIERVQGPGGPVETCEACDGTGDGEWEVVT